MLVRPIEQGHASADTVALVLTLLAFPSTRTAALSGILQCRGVAVCLTVNFDL